MMGLDDPFAYGEPESGSSGPLGDRNPVELVEDPLQVGFRYTGANRFAPCSAESKVYEVVW